MNTLFTRLVVGAMSTPNRVFMARMNAGAPLHEPLAERFRTPGAEGCTDYPALGAV